MIHRRCIGIDNEGFYDYQAARSDDLLAQGRKRIIWPQTTFYDIAVSSLHFLAQIAPSQIIVGRNTAVTLRIGRRLRCSIARLIHVRRLPPTPALPLPLDISKNDW